MTYYRRDINPDERQLDMDSFSLRPLLPDVHTANARHWANRGLMFLFVAVKKAKNVELFGLYLILKIAK